MGMGSVDTRTDQGGHPAGDAVVATMREKFVSVSCGAAVGLVDLRCGNSGSQQLEVAGWAQVGVAFAVIGAADGGGVAEGFYKMIEFLGADFEGAEANAGADGSEKAI